jgi:hypothetical protein
MQRSPLLLVLLQLPRGALLFDEMGLGKTIQAIGAVVTGHKAAAMCAAASAAVVSPPLTESCPQYDVFHLN